MFSYQKVRCLRSKLGGKRTTDAVLIDNRLTRFGWLCGEDLPAGCRNICIPIDDVIAVKVWVNAGERLAVAVRPGGNAGWLATAE